ncbi:MAG: ribokinase [Cereibacter sphaeroides]|uniref:Ribokinase n=1 Tax=Cereibacter sphaeroides TaxID=1063 RepID=A0A2W5S7R0_CERSP|nr:MAG: ribokinase [Cereibacter sphaeroides]
MPNPLILSFGDNVVDCYEDQGLMYPGGNCLNHSVFAHRFGAETFYAGAVADDPAGRCIREALEREGVDTTRLRTLPGTTAFCVIGTEGGERVFLGADLGVSIIGPMLADLDLMARMDAVHTGRSSHVDAWIPHIAARTKLSYDFATVHDSDRIARVAPHCFLASFSGGGLTYDGASRLAEIAGRAGARHVLVTRGENGAILVSSGQVTETRAATITPLDTLGAGDTFIARVLVGLLRGEKPVDLLAAAAAEAAHTCSWYGGFGHAEPMEIDLSLSKSVDEIYRITMPVPAPPFASCSSGKLQ